MKINNPNDRFLRKVQKVFTLNFGTFMDYYYQKTGEILHEEYIDIYQEYDEEIGGDVVEIVYDRKGWWCSPDNFEERGYLYLGGIIFNWI